jgi:hypothetical protein
VAEVIREFLVSLGYKIEGGQEAKFKTSVEGVTKSVVALGAAAAAVSTAVSAAVIKIGQSLDSLYWQAQRVNTTVGQIRSASYAISQLGGSVDGARSSIEGFGKNLKWNVGFEGFLKQVGVVTRSNGQLRDSVALMRDFANVLKGKSKTEQMGLAEFAGIDLQTLEALQSGDFAKHSAKHAETVRKLGVNEDEAAKKANALVQSLTSLNDTFTALGTLLVDRLGPGLTDFFGKVERFLRDNSENIVSVFRSLGEALSNVAAFLEKAAEWAGPLFQKFDALTKSLVGTDGLTAAFTALIGLGVAAWLTKVAAAITAVGTAASVALLGGALGKFMRLFGVGGAIAIGMSPTEANGGEDEAIAQRRAAGTFGPAKAGELEADAAKRQQAQSKGGSLWGKASAAPRDDRNLWQRIAPKMLGGKDAPERPASAAPIGGSSFDQKAPGVMKRLMEDFGFTKEQAAGVVGNLGHESGGFTEMQEKNPTRGRGGWGWAQWTGPRRKAFEAWTAEKGLDPASDEANYGFLKRELETTHKSVVGAVKGTKTSSEAMQIFEDGYEGAGIKHYGSRQRWTDRALKAFDATPEAAPAASEGGHQEAYRRKTGRDLSADLNSNDQFVREWAAKEAGVTQGPQSEDVVRPKSWQDREREADRQTDMGRQQSYENSLPGAEEAKASPAPQEKPAEPKADKSGFKVDNRLGENERGNAASNSLFNSQGLADQKLDGRLTKTKEATASLFSPESPLIRAADNAASIGGPGLGGNGSALTPPPASTAGTNVTIDQKNEINITGSGDPHDTAQRIGQTQKDVNSGMMRDLKGAVR